VPDQDGSDVDARHLAASCKSPVPARRASSNDEVSHPVRSATAAPWGVNDRWGGIIKRIRAFLLE